MTSRSQSVRLAVERLSPFLAIVALIACLSPAACSSSLPDSPEVPTPVAATGPITVVLATQDLHAGLNRFVFGILGSGSEPVVVPEVRPIFLYLDATPPDTRAHVVARFVPWPAGTAGAYVTEVFFDQPGRWGLAVEATLEDGSVVMGQAGFVVKSKSSSPGINWPAPRSRNKTTGDVSSLREISSAETPDPELYQMTIEEALTTGAPTVVTFASPSYCKSATCAPQVEAVASLKDRYKERANFIHVEVYDNPAEMKSDASAGQLSPIVEEWGLLSAPFTFVLDSGGFVASRFEGFVTETELEEALSAVLDR